MTSRQFAACIQAYEGIAQRHPEHAATCHGQIGAAHFFLGDPQRAISHHEHAKALGEDHAMMNESIQEARQVLAR